MNCAWSNIAFSGIDTVYVPIDGGVPVTNGSDGPTVTGCVNGVADG